MNRRLVWIVVFGLAHFGNNEWSPDGKFVPCGKATEGSRRLYASESRIEFWKTS